MNWLILSLKEKETSGEKQPAMGGFYYHFTCGRFGYRQLKMRKNNIFFESENGNFKFNLKFDLSCFTDILFWYVKLKKNIF